MKAEFWIERWTRGEIGFHRDDVHDYLASHWTSLLLAAGSRVFVPLSGKSRDMVWLRGLGHHVIGSELSEIAVDDFFAERGLKPAVREVGAFKVKSVEGYELWCGDFFELPAAALAGVAGVYDRAALVAMPPEMQPQYAAKLLSVVPKDAQMLLINLAYPDGQMQGPPFSTPLSMIAHLFGATHRITLAESRDGLEMSQNLKERGLTKLDEEAYILRPIA